MNVTCIDRGVAWTIIQNIYTRFRCLNILRKNVYISAFIRDINTISSGTNDTTIYMNICTSFSSVITIYSITCSFYSLSMYIDIMGIITIFDVNSIAI